MMNKEEQLSQHLAKHGVSFISDFGKPGKGAVPANTYFLKMNNGNYLIDPAFGEKRLMEIKDQIPFHEFDLLLTHTHLDHSANSGLAAGGHTRVILHPLAAGRLNRFKRNYTEIIPEMVKQFGVHGLLGRTGLRKPKQVKQLQLLKHFFPYLTSLITKIVSLQICRKAIGRVYPPKRNLFFLNYDEMLELTFENTLFRGWVISDGFYALETPGHQDDHLSFYLPEEKIMFSGDLISFLNPNDILDGSIQETRIGMQKMLQLAEAGGIEILAAGHILPVIGKEKIVSLIGAVIARQEATFNMVTDIISSCRDKTDFEEVINKIYAQDSELMKKILKINYPRTVSFIDVYVYLYMKEFIVGS